MKRSIKFLLLILAVTMVLSVAVSATAETKVHNGVQVELLTDKEYYSSGESVQCTLNVANSNEQELEIAYNVQIPDCLQSAANDKGILLVASGDRVTSSFALQAGNRGADSLPVTGDDFPLGWVMLLLAAALAAFVLLCPKKKQMISFILLFTLLFGVVEPAFRNTAVAEGVMVIAENIGLTEEELDYQMDLAEQKTLQEEDELIQISSELLDQFTVEKNVVVDNQLVTIRVNVTVSTAGDTAVNAKASLATPTLKPVTILGKTKFKLTWNKVAGATHYEVWHSYGNGYIKRATCVGTTWTTNYGKEGYYNTYKVRAIKKVGNTTVEKSSYATRTCFGMDASTITSVTKVSDGLKIQWTNGSPCHQVNLYYSPTGATGTFVLQDILVLTSGGMLQEGVSYSWTDTEHTSGYYKLRPQYRASSGTFYYSGPASNGKGVAAATNPPTTPTGVTATAQSSSSIKVNWTKVTGATGYYVYRSSTAGGTYSKVKTVTSGSTVTYTDTGLTANKTYYYKISAYNAAGEGSKSSYAYATTFKLEPYGTFNETTITLAQGGTATFTVSGGVKNSTNLVYSVNGARPDGSGLSISSWIGHKVTGQSTFSETFTINATSEGEFYTPGTYTLKLWVRDASAQTSEHADSMTVVVERAVSPDPGHDDVVLPWPPSTPQNVYAVTQSSSTIEVTWDKVTDATGYYVYRAPSTDGPYTKIKTITSGNTLSYLDTGLTPNTVYCYKVSAYNANGESELSEFDADWTDPDPGLDLTPEPYGSFNKTTITLAQGGTATFTVSGGVENSTNFVYSVNGTRPDGSGLGISSWSGITVTGQSTFSKTFTINAASGGEFYTPGTYTLRLWVRDASVQTSEEMDSMTVVVTGSSDPWEEISSNKDMNATTAKNMILTNEYSSWSTKGKIRYIQQYFSGNDCYYSSYWATQNVKHMCDVAAGCMGLSYMGDNTLPKNVEGASFSKNNRIASVGNKAGYSVNCFTSLKSFVNAYNSYANSNGSYSPIMIFTAWKNGGTGYHAIVIIGRDNSDPTLFYAVDPGAGKNYLLKKVRFVESGNSLLIQDVYWVSNGNRVSYYDTSCTPVYYYQYSKQ